jgi:predicted nucleic acid-binding protein
MSRPAWLNLTRALADTGVFVLWNRGDLQARLFLRNPNVEIYYSKVTRKELLRRPINNAERRRIVRVLEAFRLINPEASIAAGYSDLLTRYSYLRDHLADTLIAASAWTKHLLLLTTNVRPTNVRHFEAIQEIQVVRF